jgi:hypothetical protein
MAELTHGSYMQPAWPAVRTAPNLNLVIMVSPIPDGA